MSTHSAASRIGLSHREYQRLLKNGLAWCCGCRQWHTKNKFARSTTRSTGLQSHCMEFKARKRRGLE